MSPHENDEEHLNYLIRNLELLEEKCDRDIKIKNFSNVYTYMREYNSLLVAIKEEFANLSSYFKPVNIEMPFMDRFFGDQNEWYLAKLSKVDHYASRLLVHISRPVQIENDRTKSDLPLETSEILKILDLVDNKLRKTFRELPKDESEVQDRFEDLLTARDIDYLREQEKIVYSSKTYQPDFSFPQINTLVEIKYCDKKRA